MIFNSMADSLHVVDADMSIVFMNSHFRTWNASLGLNTKVVGKNIFDTFPFIPEHAKDEYRQVFSTAETLVTQESSFIEDKEIFTETRKIPVIRVEKVVQVITIVRDMTEQVQARDALRRSEEMFRSFIEQSTDGIMLTDEQGRIKDWNQSLEQITGWDKEQISNRYMWDIPSQMLGDVQKDKELHNRLEENIRSFLMRGESPWASKFVEYNIIHKRGDSRTVQVVIFPIKTEMGIVIGSTVRDITDRRRYELQLQRAKLEWEATFDAVSDMVILADVDGEIIRCNRATVGRFEKTYEDIVGMPVEHLFFGEQTDVNMVGLSDEVQFPFLEGWFDVSSYPVEVEGTPLGTVFIVTDITERKRIEQHLIETQKMTSLGTLVAGIAHEMNTPLQIITGASKTLLNKQKEGSLGEDKLVRNLKRINENGWRMADVVRSLIMFTRPTTDKIEPCDINLLLKETIVLIQHRIRQELKYVLTLELSPDLPVFHCDKNKISQMLFNLLSNALDAMPNGGDLIVRTVQMADDGKFLIQVQDTGAGMAPEVQMNIFDPFFTTKQFGRGTGLGLSIVKGVVEAHAGEITVESEPGKGSIFTLVFPIAPEKDIETSVR